MVEPEKICVYPNLTFKPESQVIYNSHEIAHIPIQDACPSFDVKTFIISFASSFAIPIIAAVTYLAYQKDTLDSSCTPSESATNQAEMTELVPAVFIAIPANLD